jgi:CheY-like chemotaxis protein
VATALIVDDAAVDRMLAGKLLETRAEMNVIFAENGRAALEAVKTHQPDLVVTDLQMPEMDGLELVDALRRSHPDLPIILMTGMGSEDVAASALRKGAASYVPKRLLSRDLAPTAERLLDMAGVQRQQELAMQCLAEVKCQLVLDSDPQRIGPVVQYLRQQVAHLRLCDDNALMRMGVALDEAICNAIHHGNLEVSSELREENLAAYFDKIKERSTLPPYSQRRVFLSATLTHDRATFVVRDQGAGFNPASLPDATDPQCLLKVSGRGLLLIRTFMDEVRHNATGNEITMVKHRTASATGDGGVSPGLVTQAG